MRFNYATLAGSYHFAGYDPIAPSRQRRAALGLNYTAQIEQPVTAELIEYLGSWSVRWIIAPSGSMNARALAGLDELALTGDDGRVAVFEHLRCSPLAEIRTPSSRETIPVPVTIAGNSLQLDVGERQGVVTVNYVYHPSYVLVADGKRVDELQETDDHRMQFRATGGVRRISIHFSDRLFARGVILAILTCGATLLLLIRNDYGSPTETWSRLGNRSLADSCSSAESSSTTASSSELSEAVASSSPRF
jgi:hypothetical protein